MGQVTYRGNLTTGYYPFLVSAQGQTIIIPRQDQNVTPRDPALSGESVADRDRGFPQVSYMHNVMPTPQGFKSIGFLERIPGIGVNTFNNIFILRDIFENKYLYSPVSGKHYVWDGNFRVWTAAKNTVIPSSSLVTVAYINGFTYIFFSKVGMFSYDPGTQTLVAVALTGVTAANLNGICASNGFLIAWDDFAVYRSQATDVLNFTSDPSLGSGSSIPNDIKGKIICCLPISDGFIIYCAKNAVAASFQNNIQYPFIYKEVKGSAGIVSPNHVTWVTNLGLHYVWSTNGLLILNKTQVTQVFPEVTDFLTAEVYESFNTTTNILEVTNLTAPLNIKLALIADRFLVISYGIDYNVFTDALIYDIGYKRWGKVQLNHVAAFEYYTPNVSSPITWNGFGILTWNDLGNTSWDDLATGLQTVDYANTIIAFLEVDGTIVTLRLDLVSENESGVLILGKYQYIRGNLLVLDEVAIKNVTRGEFSIYDLPTYDGDTFEAAQELIESPYNVGLSSNYYTAIEALNHSLVLEGTFNVADIELTFHLGGRA